MLPRSLSVVTLTALALCLLAGSALAQLNPTMLYAQPSSMDLLALKAGPTNSLLIVIDDSYAIIPERDCARDSLFRYRITAAGAPMTITDCGQGWIQGYLSLPLNSTAATAARASSASEHDCSRHSATAATTTVNDNDVYPRSGPIEIFSPRYKFTTVSKFNFTINDNYHSIARIDNSGMTANSPRAVDSSVAEYRGSIGKLLSPYAFISKSGSMDVLFTVLGFATEQLTGPGAVLAVTVGGVPCAGVEVDVLVDNDSAQITCSLPLGCVSVPFAAASSDTESSAATVTADAATGVAMVTDGPCPAPLSRVDVVFTATTAKKTVSAVLKEGFIWLPPLTATHLSPPAAPSSAVFKFYLTVRSLPDVVPYELTVTGMPHGEFFPLAPYNARGSVFQTETARCDGCPKGTYPLAVVWRFEGVPHVIAQTGLALTIVQ